MCKAYTISASREQLQSHFDVTVPAQYQARYNARPGQLLPVITAKNAQVLSFFYWGLIPSWSKNKSVSEKLINVKAELLLDKVSSNVALGSRRCLVPTNGFYDWKQISKKGIIPYRFILNQENLFGFAGLWEEFETNNGESAHTFTIITTHANEAIASTNSRMPVILNPEAEKIWLNPNSKKEELMQILIPSVSSAMGNYAVSSKVNNPANDSPDLLLPAPAADQFGNYSLFD